MLDSINGPRLEPPKRQLASSQSLLNRGLPGSPNRLRCGQILDLNRVRSLLPLTYHRFHFTQVLVHGEMALAGLPECKYITSHLSACCWSERGQILSNFQLPNLADCAVVSIMGRMVNHGREGVDVMPLRNFVLNADLDKAAQARILDGFMDAKSQQILLSPNSSRPNVDVFVRAVQWRPNQERPATKANGPSCRHTEKND